MVLAQAAGLASEHSRRLWWYVHSAAHWRCGAGFGCDRKSFFGHQIMFMVAGSGKGTYRGQTWTAGAGEAVLMDLRQPHSYWSERANPWEMYWVLLDGPGVAAVFDALLSSAGSCVIPFASADRMRADFKGLFTLLSQHPAGFDAWVWQHLTALVANVVEGFRRSTGHAGTAADQAPAGIRAALALLHREHHRALALRELARAAHMSTFHFARRFKALLGFTAMEYLEKLRIGRAQELLLARPELRLGAVALSVGYADPAYFSRVFRKCLGVSPRAYRQNLMGRG